MSQPIMISMESQSNPAIIAEIQRRLAADLGNDLKVDGRFGPKTDEAVRTYQQKHGLHVDGIIGEITFAKLTNTQAPAIAKYTPPVRGKIVARSLEDKLHRAIGCIGAPVTYHLQYPNGGTDPEGTMPCDEHTGFCDCSGFNAWVQGFDRLQKTFKLWGGYINTDSKIFEAEHDGVWFTVLDEPEVGCMIVGESFKDENGKLTIGHEGTVVDVSEWEHNGLAGIQVVHCSSSNRNLNKEKSAIWKTSGTIWKRFRKFKFLRFNAEAALALRA